MALTEILYHELDVAQMEPLLATATLAEEVSRTLARAKKAAEATLALLRANIETLHATEGKQTVRRDEAREMVAGIVAMHHHAKNFAEGLRANAWSKQHRQPSNKKRKDLLLTAAWQHLDWGGLTYEEIFELVPTLGEVVCPPDAVRIRIKDVVRARVKEPNARSFMPREQHPKLYERPKVEKRQRRRSST